MPPFLGGGSMIETVTLERTTFAAPPGAVLEESTSTTGTTRSSSDAIAS